MYYFRDWSKKKQKTNNKQQALRWFSVPLLMKQNYVLYISQLIHAHLTYKFLYVEYQLLVIDIPFLQGM